MCMYIRNSETWSPKRTRNGKSICGKMRGVESEEILPPIVRATVHYAMPHEGVCCRKYAELEQKRKEEEDMKVVI